MKQSFHTKKGFTLIEALVAVSMLTLVIISVLGLAQSSISANTSAQVQVTANYLAGEAIEYIRNIRDNNILSGQDWREGIDTQCFNARGCDVDTINADINNGFMTDLCDEDDGCPPLKFDNDINSGFYHHGSGQNSSLSRTIHIEEMNNNDDEIAVKVTITSNSGYFKLSPLVVVEHMFNLAPLEEAEEEQQQGEEQSQQSQE